VDHLQHRRYQLRLRRSRNLRAQHPHASEGFIVEGTLRDAVRLDEGYDSLVVMAMLQGEYAQRVATGEESG
jgi:diamine N-acetyltransferase